MKNRMREILIFVFIAFVVIVPKCIHDAGKENKQLPDSRDYQIEPRPGVSD